ncbi:SAM-dependent methyltransferase [Halonatronum saccharophilum]|uniref:SAM-dependent methyltransferase n=1 Tax=Halonatronum saccharophilum TaxID=150060 RepID=UPI0004B179C3|nr:methyltransferase domain-containing protein [Halonatronum saccharophilum]
MDRFKRVNNYDQKWIDENRMGPNPLYGLEDLTNQMDLKEGMRVLDLGCGKAMTSIFLAKEFGVEVWATDLWIDQTENWERIKEAGVEDKVFPIKGEAHQLPYAEGFFDAVVSIDAYHYFGTNELYLPWYLHKLVKPGGEIGIVVPGLTRELKGGIPKGVEEYWANDMFTFHSGEWWKNHWSKTGLVEVQLVRDIEDSKEIWKTSQFEIDEKLMEADVEDCLTFVMVLANKR